MLKTREFLVHELNNVEAALNEALRFDFGGSRSQHFFKECRRRLVFLLHNTKVAHDPGTIAGLITRVSKLSELIARFERSHIGEFSWPFAYELESLAKLACAGVPMSQKETVDDPRHPLFFFSSFGGLNAYAIHIEEPEEDPAAAARSIFSVVFPRSLKHQVLLHAVLGHELGHAFFASAIRRPIYNETIALLFRDTAFYSLDGLKDWLKKHFPKTNYKGIDPKSLSNIRNAWEQEVFCDIFGLLTLGPAFLPAIHTLLHAIDSDGRTLSSTHPPSLMRYQVLKIVWRDLKWTTQVRKADPKAADWLRQLSATTDSAADLNNDLARTIPVDRILEASRYLAKQLSNIGLMYKPPGGKTISDLVRLVTNDIPPSTTIAASRLKAKHKPIDFRNILAAGWLACVQEFPRTGDWLSPNLSPKDKDRFYLINRLCELGILQGRGIQIQYPGDGT